MPTTIMFAGGTSYTEDLLFRMVADSIATDREAEIETHRRTFTHAAQRPTVYMPSHDADSPSAQPTGSPSSRSARRPPTPNSGGRWHELRERDRPVD
jgi:hypothetical protein